MKYVKTVDITFDDLLKADSNKVKVLNDPEHEDYINDKLTVIYDEDSLK